MSADKYPSIFSRQIEAIVYIFSRQMEAIVHLCDSQINARALIGQSVMVYCASKLMEKLRVFCIIIFNK